MSDEVKGADEVTEEASKPLETSAKAAQSGVVVNDDNKSNLALYIAIAALALVVLKRK